MLWHFVSKKTLCCFNNYLFQLIFYKKLNFFVILVYECFKGFSLKVFHCCIDWYLICMHLVFVILCCNDVSTSIFMQI